MCDARDRRIEKLKNLSQKKCSGLILLTLNIPGEIKDSPLYRNIFRQGTRAVKVSLTGSGGKYRTEEIQDLRTGSEAYFTVTDPDLFKIKRITAEIEESHPLGRIFDIDLFDINLEQIKTGREMRKCFVCERGAFECSRARRHNTDEVLAKIKSTAEEYFDSVFWKIASTAVRAMITEVLVTPKPGLVDRSNPGAHSDMDIFTFADSSTALARTFYRIASEGGNFKGENLSELLPSLREIGIEGEREMYRITGGVNTQKGLIFSIGLLSAASGYIISSKDEVPTPETLCRTGGEAASGITEKDISSGKNLETTGIRLFREYGIKGARGEAEGGFPSALRALERLKKCLSENMDFNTALAVTLIHIIAETEDTNIPGRGSIDTLSYAKETARSFIMKKTLNTGDTLKELERMDLDFIGRNISPGGSADILAVTLFLYFMEKEFC